jgi:hypothetical protein
LAFEASSSSLGPILDCIWRRWRVSNDKWWASTAGKWSCMTMSYGHWIFNFNFKNMILLHRRCEEKKKKKKTTLFCRRLGSPPRRRRNLNKWDRLFVSFIHSFIHSFPRGIGLVWVDGWCDAVRAQQRHKLH